MAEIRWQKKVDPQSGRPYEVFQPPSLRGKVKRITAAEARQMLTRADAQVSDLSARFEERARAQVAGLVAALAAAAKLVDETARWQPPVREAFDALHIEGSAFGYPLLSKIGDSACRVIDSAAAPGDVLLDLLESHANAMTTVLAHRLHGDGGAEGRILLSVVRAVATSFSHDGGPSRR